MDDGVVCNGNVITDIHGRFPVRAMHDHTILDIHVVADPDVVNISPNDGIEPDAAIVPDNDIAHDRSVFRQETPLTDVWDDPFHCSDQCHSLRNI
jgi:hypothetical protein